MSRLLPGFLVLLFLFSCTQDEHNHPEKIVSRKTNLSYGSDARNKMDVYLPANRTTSTPFILLIHGGAWVAGDKADMHAIQENLLTKGIASASMNYRYASATVHYPQLMEDVHNALMYCRAHSTEWIIRPDKFLTGGASAGAHMSLLYAYRYNPDNFISGVISAAGPTDFTDDVWMNYAATVGLQNSIEAMTGHPYTDDPDSSYIYSSPALNVKNVPTLMIHGTADLVVFYSQAERLNAALADSGYTKRLFTLQDANHDLNLGNPATFNDVADEISSWINEYGK